MLELLLQVFTQTDHHTTITTTTTTTRDKCYNLKISNNFACFAMVGHQPVGPSLISKPLECQPFISQTEWNKIRNQNVQLLPRFEQFVLDTQLLIRIDPDAVYE